MSATLTQIEVNNTKVPLLYEQSSHLPILSMQLTFEASGAIADGNMTGLAKLTANMLGEGTKSLGATKFAKLIDAKAIEIHASIGRETFVISVECLKSEFSHALKYLTMLLNEPNLTEETLKKVQTKMVGALKQKESDYDYQASIELMPLLFNNTPIAHPLSGTAKSIEKISLSDVTNFVQTHLTKSNVMVLIGGDLTPHEAKEATLEIVSILPEGTKQAIGFYEASAKTQEKVVKRITEQAYIYFGAPFSTKMSDIDSYKAKVAAFILGSSGFGSRLMEEVRVKRGLAYSAYGRINMAKSHSYFSGYLQTKIERADEAKAVVVEVINTFIKNGATQKELESAKQFLLGSEPLRTETLSQRLSRSFQEVYNGKPLGATKAELEAINALTLDDLNSYISAHPEIQSLSFSIITK